MNNLVLAAQRFLLDEEGASAVEYGLLVAVISVAVLGASLTIAANLKTILGRISTCLVASVATGCI